jgi:hypothetical protein
MLSALKNILSWNPAGADAGRVPRTLLAVALLVNPVVVLYGPVLVDLVRQRRWPAMPCATRRGSRS